MWSDPCDKRVTLVSPCENDFISNNIRNICNSAFATLLQYNSLFATTVGHYMTFFNLCSARSSMQMQVLQEAPVDQVPFAKLDGAMKPTGAGLNSSLRSGFASKEVLYNKTTWNLTTNVFFNHKSNLQEIYFGCRVTTTYAGLGWVRQEQKIVESGSASTSCQDNLTR